MTLRAVSLLFRHMRDRSIFSLRIPLSFLVGFVLFWAIAPIAIGQDDLAIKDPSAVAAIKKAMEAMRGQPLFEALHDVTVSGAFGQDSTTGSAGRSVAWKSIGPAFRYESTDSAGTSIEVVQDGAGSIRYSSGTFSPLSPSLAAASFPQPLVGLVLLDLLKNPTVSLATVDDGSGTSSLIHIRSQKQLLDQSLALVTTQDWFFDLGTQLPSRVEYRIPDPNDSSGDALGCAVFKSWQSTPTVLFPKLIEFTRDGSAIGTLTIDVPLYNQGLTSAIFQFD